MVREIHGVFLKAVAVHAGQRTIRWECGEASVVMALTLSGVNSQHAIAGPLDDFLPLRLQDDFARQTRG